jgi:hypothetical protein
MEKEFNASIENSEKRMTAMFQMYMGDMIRQSDEALKMMALKSTEIAEKIMTMTINNASPPGTNTTSPPRKRQRLQDDGTAMVDVTQSTTLPS